MQCIIKYQTREHSQSAFLSQHQCTGPLKLRFPQLKVNRDSNVDFWIDPDPNDWLTWCLTGSLTYIPHALIR